MRRADHGNSGAFGTKKPLVTVRRQKVDRRLRNVQRIDTEPLNRVEKYGHAALVSPLHQRINVDPITAGVNQPMRPKMMRVEESTFCIRSSTRTSPLRRGTTRTSTPRERWFLPREQVAGKFAFGKHHIVARLPGPTVGYQVDARRRVTHHANFTRLAADELGRVLPQRLDPRPPIGAKPYHPGWPPDWRISAIASAAGWLKGATAA